jgi:nucleotide-binding universal stress UspA family protein
VPFDHILVPVDGSVIANTALEFAVERAKLHNSNITVAFVVDATQILQARDAEADALLNAAESIVRGAGVNVQRARLEGHAGPSILAFARQARPDVIVMGSHGRRGLERLALGSTAEEVIRAAAIPVFVIPQRAGETAKTGPLTHLVVAVDGSPAADDALAFACELAQQEGARVTLCTVAEASGGDSGDLDRGVFLQAEVDERARPLLERYRLRASSVGLDVNADLRQGDAVTEILEAAQQTGADAIVLGTHGRAGIPRFILGSVAAGVLRSSRLPVCTVRQ